MQITPLQELQLFLKEMKVVKDNHFILKVTFSNWDTSLAKKPSKSWPSLVFRHS